ncbi:unnamed protein product [Gongylonema pulchrum]|uniref:glucuronosyltransferase n=1 Tax=Gongylonema pulchrum TaxID=637853 RepID=A0A183D154_9BILA|nr:unnamed protein product [Gongylonema pulchrum]
MLVTFGSIARTSHLCPEAQQALLDAMQSFPNINFVLKYENVDSTLYQLSKNVYLAKWIPQVELMAHQAFLGIITHGGWNSVLESVYYGRPAVVIPLFADQYHNARVIEQKQIAIVIDKFEISRRNLQKAIREITNNRKLVFSCSNFNQNYVNNRSAAFGVC